MKEPDSHIGQKKKAKKHKKHIIKKPESELESHNDKVLNEKLMVVNPI